MLEHIIRSEAHFAAMLFCELRKPSEVGRAFLEAIELAVGESPGEITHVFVEPAPFRDAWYALDDDGRRHLASRLLRLVDPKVDPAQLSSMYTVLKRKIRSPASWNRQEMRKASPLLEALYFMFRARPDLLVITAKFALWIELKVESGIPQRRNGYLQHETQQHIAKAVHIVIPELAERKPKNILIQREASQECLHLTWQQIVGNQSAWAFDILKPKKARSPKKTKLRLA